MILAIIIWIVALVLSVLGGRLVTGWVLRSAARSPHSDPHGELDPGGDQDCGGERAPSGNAAIEGGTMGTQAVRALRGGWWIGNLERLATTGCIMAGFPAGIAFVIAVKGLGRYPELREHPIASERFVIGTLASVSWAAAVGAAGVKLVALVL